MKIVVYRLAECLVLAFHTILVRESPSLYDGVFLYCLSARSNLFLSRDRPHHADQISFFMDLTVALAFPLL